MSRDELHLVLLTGETVPLRKGEFLRIARHRYLLAFYLGIFVFILFANLRGGLSAAILGVNSLIHLVSVTAGVFCLLTAHRVTAFVARRRGRVPVLHLPYVLTLVVTVAMVAGDGLETLVLDKPVGTPFAVLARWGFYVIAAQLGTALAMHFILPRILGELRGQNLSGLNELDAAESAPAKMELGGAVIALDDLLHLHADGNRVIANTRTGQIVLSGPLSAIVAQLPEAAGCAVHRSDWVAAHAVVGYRREGRSVTLFLTDGTGVLAAQTRLTQVLAWLESIGAVAGEQARVTADLP